MQPDGRLEIGSNTKSFTVALIMQLQEEGLLSLDDPLSKYLPEWAAKLPNGDKITVRQMAQHTAGLWDYADDDHRRRGQRSGRAGEGLYARRVGAVRDR